MEADPRPHANDKITHNKCDQLYGVDGVGAEPEDTGHGACQRQADQEGVVDALLKSGAAGENPSGLGESDWRAGTGGGQKGRFISPWSLATRVSGAVKPASSKMHEGAAGIKKVAEGERKTMLPPDTMLFP